LLSPQTKHMREVGCFFMYSAIRKVQARDPT
jgi:hypothetical protein